MEAITILRYFTLIGLISFIVNCSSNDTTEGTDSIPVITPTVQESIPLTDFQPFLNPADEGILSSSFLGLIDKERFYLYDDRHRTFYLLNEQGKILQHFGREGKGPGEFMRPMFTKKEKNVLYFMDEDLFQIIKFDINGEYIGQYSYDSKYHWGHSWLLEDSVLVASAGGINGGLLVKKNLRTDSLTYFGKPKAPFNIEESLSDVTQAVNDLAKAKIPVFLKNMATIRADHDFIYAYLSMYCELRKYTINGQLVWERKLNLPANKEIFNNAMESAREQQSSNRPMIPSIQYISGLEITNGEIFILTNYTQKVPRLLLRINAQGNLVSSYYFPKQEKQESPRYVSNFVYKTDNNTLYVEFNDSPWIYKTTLQ